jgi:AraC family transcriptional regulator
LGLISLPPLLNSQGRDWKGIVVEYHRQPAWEMPEFSDSQHILVVEHSGQSTPLERKLGDRLQDEQITPEDVVIIPAGMTCQARWDRESTYTLLRLEPIYFQSVAKEIIESKQIELLPQFAPT